MKTSERINGTTPNGGVYSIAYFYDKNNNPCSKKDAVKVVVNEFDKDDKIINTSYATNAK